MGRRFDQSPQELRNDIGNGWANYVDNTYTEGSPLQLAATTAVNLPNDAKGSLTNEIYKPNDLSTMYSPGQLDYDAKTADFAVGDTITGGTSGATAVVTKVKDNGDNTGTLYLKTVTGTFQNDETITSSAGSATVNGTIGAGVIMGLEGDAKILTLEFKAKPSNAGTTYLEVWLDIGGSVGELYRRIVSFPKGNGVERPVTLSTAVYALDTWESNEAEIWIETPNTCDVYDIRFILYRLHRAV